jgi:hypothetical protein
MFLGQVWPENNRRQRVDIAEVLKTMSICLCPPRPGGPGGGTGLPFSAGYLWFWAHSGPDPGGTTFVLILIMALSTAGKTM